MSSLVVAILPRDGCAAIRLALHFVPSKRVGRERGKGIEEEETGFSCNNTGETRVILLSVRSEGFL